VPELLPVRLPGPLAEQPQCQSHSYPSRNKRDYAGAWPRWTQFRSVSWLTASSLPTCRNDRPDERTSSTRVPAEPLGILRWTGHQGHPSRPLFGFGMSDSEAEPHPGGRPRTPFRSLTGSTPASAPGSLPGGIHPGSLASSFGPGCVSRHIDSGTRRAGPCLAREISLGPDCG
jgi:hypothetical protein